MLNKYITFFKYIVIAVVTSGIGPFGISSTSLFAQERSKIDFNFFATNGYMKKNNDFLIKATSKWNDYFSSIGGELTFRGGAFGQSQYEMSMRYITTFTNPNKSFFTLRQLYIQVPLTDYTFLTIGKREKEFGFGDFHNFSNRLSPKQRLLGHIERLERQGPGIIQFDWILSQAISLGAFLWSSNSSGWKNSNVGMQTELQFDNFYSGLYFYYEKLKFWSVGINTSEQMDKFRLYGEGIIKKGNEQYYTQKLNFNNNGRQFSFSVGLAYELSGYLTSYSAKLEYAYRTEGFNKSERNKIKELVKNTGDILGYNLSYFGKNYLGIDFSTSRFFITNLSASLSNLISLGSFGGELSANLSYLHKEEVTFGANMVYYYGKKNSEYKLYIPFQYQLIAFVSLSF